MKALIAREVRRLCNLEQLGVHGYGFGVRGCGHSAFGGPVGVGKTYVLRGISLVTAALCQCAFPVTFDYEGAGAFHADPAVAKKGVVSVHALLSAALTDGSFPTPDDELSFLKDTLTDDIAAAVLRVESVVHRFTGTRRFPVLILDEITAWYRDDELKLRGMGIIEQLQQFGRSPNVMALMSGSSACMRSQLFAAGKWKDYHTLNASIFSFQEIAPLRDIHTLYAYMNACDLTFDGSLGKLLSLSGGVGRVINDLCRAPDGSHSAGLLQPDSNTIRNDVRFGILARYLVHENEEKIAEEEYPLPVRIAAVGALNTLMHNAGCTSEEAVELLDAWCDASLLLYTESRKNIELLYPYHAKIITDTLATDNYDLVLQAQIQLRGGYASVGRAVEKLLRPHIHALFGAGVHPGGILTRHSKAAYYSALPGFAAQLFVPSAHLGVRIEWADQIGFADFMLEAGPDGVIHVDAWQCNILRTGSVVKAGDVTEAFAAIISAKRHVLCSLDPVNKVADALATAAWGYCAITAILAHAESERVFVPRRLHLCTTGILNKHASDAAAAGFTITRDMVNAFNTSRAAADLGAVCSLTAESFVEVSVLDGLEWTDRHFPATQHISSEDLRRREVLARESL
jgi:hypothetical protein